ncbi:Cleavage polyadenylation factor subunit clp1 [Massospora cicadina]|nr:Cleavage polyadenylation factor subunit clp1 [Massospora cicadina]
MATTQPPALEKKGWSLTKEQELRLEVGPKETLKLKLVSGTAEVFGTELGKDVWYNFTDQKLAIFTWHGCELTISFLVTSLYHVISLSLTRFAFYAEGSCTVDYIADETPMSSYINIHLALEGQRARSAREDVRGPTVLIVGPKDSGKSSLAKILLSYAIKQGREPMFIALDPNEGSVTMPGCLLAIPLKHQLDVEVGLSNTLAPTSEDESVPQPLIQVERLGEMLKRRLEVDKDLKSSGCIIDTCGLADDVGFKLHMHTIEALDVDAVLVVGHERLYSDLVRANKGSKVTILRLAKSGGVVNRDPALMRHLQMKSIREYFYGCPGHDLSPSPNLVKFEDVSIFKVGEGVLAPSSALPVELGEHLLHAILAVCGAETQDEATLLRANVHGFVYISEVDAAKRTLTLLMPCPGRLPKTFLLLGSFRWIES